MKNIVFYVVIVFLSNIEGVFAQNGSKIKVITYNIYNGFDWGKEPTRQDSMAQWLIEQGADVIAFQELCGFTQEKLQNWAKKWGHNYAVILKEDGYPLGITSNKPIKIKTKMMGGLWHGLLHIETAGIDFLTVHLSPADWQFRKNEATIITDYLEKAVIPIQKNYIVLGDFNANTPFDAEFDRKSPSLLSRMLKSDAKSEKHKNLHDGLFDYSVMSTFLAGRLIDVCQRFVAEEKRYTFPTPILIGTWQTAEEVRANKQRIDYILASPELAKKCISTSIYNSGMPDMLSDHYPVSAEFEY